jgi:hypothetical protein
MKIGVPGRVLLLVCVGAAALRFWGLGYGLPHTGARPDEDLVVGKSLKISLGLMPEPRDFNYSHGVYYLEAAALLAFREAGAVLGWPSDAQGFLDEVTVTRPALHFRVCRALSAILGTLTALVAAWVAWRSYHRCGGALLAALLVAANFLHVRDSHFGTVDVPMTFFATLALGFAVGAARTQSMRDYLLAGLFAGLATSAKYNAATTACAIAAAAVPAFLARDARLGRRALRGVAAAAAAMVLAFAATSPYCVLHLSDFLRGVAVQRHELFDGAGEAAWRVHLRTTLPMAFGTAGFVMAAVGTARALWLRRPADLVLLAFVAATFACLAEITWVQARYMLPLVPPLAILAAEAIAAALRDRPPWLVAAGALLILAPVRSAVAFDRLASRPDTRLLAEEWIARTLTPRSRVAVCRGYGAPAINSDDRRFPAFEVVRVDDTLADVRGADARYLIGHSHPAIATTCPSGEALSWLRTHARPAVVFDPFLDMKGVRRCFFARDAFYLPHCRFEALERGGPVVTIWDLGPKASDNAITRHDAPREP